MKKIIFVLVSMITVYCLFPQNSENILKRKEKIKKNIFRYSAELFFVFFYYPDIWQGLNNNKTGSLGYSTRDFTDKKYHDDDNSGYIEDNPRGSIETGVFGSFSIHTKPIQTNKPLISSNEITVEFNWEFNWMQSAAGIKFTFSKY